MNSILNNKLLSVILKEYYVPYLEPYIGKFTKYGDFHIGRKGCAQFIIHKDIIRSKPKKMYEDLYTWIRSSTLGKRIGNIKIEALIMEWTWDLIFLAPLCHKSNDEPTILAHEI